MYKRQGLLFGDASTAAASTIAINIYNAGFLTAGLPTFGFQLVNKNPSGQYYTDLATWSPEAGTFTLSAVPEPATFITWSMGLGILGVVTTRRARRGVTRPVCIDGR